MVYLFKWVHKNTLSLSFQACRVREENTTCDQVCSFGTVNSQPCTLDSLSEPTSSETNHRLQTELNNTSLFDE